MANLPKLNETDKKKLYESLNIPYEEPAQIAQVFSDERINEEEILPRQQLLDKINEFEEIKLALQEMKNALATKLKKYTVRVDPKITPVVRDAIRRMFGIDSDTITYDMFEQALASRSTAIEQDRKRVYGA